SRAAARARLGLPAAAFVVAGVGRLVPIKGFDLLVDALPALVARVPSAHVLLIGDGEERAALEARAAALGVGERLRITGAVGDAALRAKLGAAAPPRAEAFSTDVAAAAMGSIYDGLVRARGLRR